MAIQIREAEANDCALIFEFIRGLARFEKLEHEVVGSPELLREHLFTRPSGASALIAELDNKPVGFALYFLSFSTFLTRPGIYLEDLFVVPESRGNGVGFYLLRRLAQIAMAKNYGRVEWSCLDWNEEALKFYRKIGATPQDEWTVLRLTGQALSKLGAT